MIDLNDSLTVKYIKAPLIAFLISAIVVGGLAYFLESLKNDFESEEKTKDRALKTTLKQVKFLRFQENVYLEYGSKYQSSLLRGLVTELDRVKWTDALLKIQEKLLLHNFNIQFEAEEKISRNNVSNLSFSKNIFYYSRLNIATGTHSDLDVIKIMSLIDEMVTPFYLLESCDLVGNDNRLEKVKFLEDEPLFKLDCTLVLFQSKPRKFKLK